jgi:nickel/cobalt transporter (NicO) family protein
MHQTSIFLLLGAAGVVAILHSILPDHWVPLAVVARTQRWNLLRVGRVSLLASLGHVITSLILGGIIALIGLQFQHQIETQQGRIVGVVLVLTGIGFLIWGLVGHGPHGHAHEEHHIHEDEHKHEHELVHKQEHLHEHKHDLIKEQPLIKRLAVIAVPFGMAASPDLTILPVALAASAIGTVAVVGVLSVFAIFTIVTFISLTMIATLAGYQIKGDWLEKNANTITSLVLIAIGIVAYVGI